MSHTCKPKRNPLLVSLLKAYEDHGNIIIGTDFDDTIFPFNTDEDNVLRCKKTVLLLSKVKNYATICLNSVADAQSLVYKEHIMELYGIPPSYVNESPVKKWGECTKPYFNIYLDDKAGLNEALEVLEEFYEQLKTKL